MKTQPKLSLDEAELQKLATSIVTQMDKLMFGMDNVPSDRAQRMEAYSNTLLNLRLLIEG